MLEENKISDINQLVELLTALSMKPLLEDELWQKYGYSKRPVKGLIWTRLFPNSFQLDDYITKETLIMGLIDVLNSIKHSNKAPEIKLVLSVGVIDQFLDTVRHLFKPDSHFDHLFSAYETYLITDNKRLHEPIILKSKDKLSKKDFAKFMVGTIALIGTEESEYYLLNGDYIIAQINNSTAENQVELIAPSLYQDYGMRVAEKILNSNRRLSIEQLGQALADNLNKNVLNDTPTS